MSYSTGMMRYRIAIQNREQSSGDTFGVGSGGYTWKVSGIIWAGYTFSKGVKSLREGALDAYDRVMFRCRPHKFIRRDSRIIFQGRTYAIESLNEDWQENTMQITAYELVNPQG